MRRYWICGGCGVQHERTRQRCGCGRARPKARVPEHARTLRDDSYEEYVRVAAAIHGVTDESCCVCGKPRSQERRHDRDHGHLKGDPAYGRPRGICCVSCNRLMPRELDAARARLVFEYLARVEAYYRIEEAA